MSSVSMNTLSNNYLQSILSRLQNAGLTANETSNSTGSVVASTSTQQTDSTQLSPWPRFWRRSSNSNNRILPSTSRLPRKSPRT